MCLIVLAHQMNPQFPLIFGGNRDEFFERPTARADYWEDAPNVLAGRDLSAGGTWFGVTRDGRFAAVTNYRDPSRRHPNPRSRGLLVSEFLRSSLSTRAFAEQLDLERDAFDGFNLLFGDRESIWYVSNREAQPARTLPPGVHALSNHLLNTPWPKVARAKRALTELLTLQEQNAVERGLLDALADQREVADDALPQSGVSLQWERVLATAFIRAEGYGTRASTIMTVAKNGQVVFTERGFDEPNEERRFEFRLPPP